MSGLEAFSLACNVLTVISFGLETVTLCRQIHETGTSDPALAESAYNFRKASEQIGSLGSKRLRSPGSDPEDRLRDIVTKSLQHAEDIEKEVAYTSPRKGGIRASILSTASTTWRKRHLDRLRERLEELRKAMDTGICVQILEQAIRSGELNETSFETLRREQKAFVSEYSSRSDAIESLIKNESKNTQLLLADARHDITHRLELQTDTIEKGISRSQDVLSADLAERAKMAECASLREQALQRLLKSLKYTGMNERQNKIRSRHRRTLEWAFKGTKPATADSSGNESSEEADAGDDANLEGRDNFLEWLQSDTRRLFWINGKPGSGKSTLMKLIQTDKRTIDALRCWRPDPAIIAHFVWKDGIHYHQQSLQGLLCSLLYQFFLRDGNIATRFLREKPDFPLKDNDTDWSTYELRDLLMEGIRGSERSYLVLLDGLDEINKRDSALDQLFELLDDLTLEPSIKICVASRQEHPFTQKFLASSSSMLRMQELTRQDIGRYCRDFLEKSGLDSRFLRGAISDEIMLRSEGVFLWVYLVLADIKLGVTTYKESWDTIHERICTLPPDLTKLYKDMWFRLDGNRESYVKRAALYFSLLSFSADFRVEATYHSSSILELAVASDDNLLHEFSSNGVLPTALELAEKCEHTHSTLGPICAGLLEAGPLDEMYGCDARDMDRVVHWDQNGVEFTHRTAKDFLESDEGKALFQSHAPSPEQTAYRYIKAALVIQCVIGKHPAPSFRQRNAWKFLRSIQRLEELSIPTGMVHYLLSLVHRWAAELGDTPLGLSHSDSFISLAAYFGQFEYVHRCLQLTHSNRVSAAVSALRGACDNPFRIESYRTAASGNRDRWIQTILKDLRWCELNHDDPVHRPRYLDGVVQAWRCFLRHKLRETGLQSNLAAQNETLNTIHAFIASGVMSDSDSHRYVVAVPVNSGGAVSVVYRNRQTVHYLWDKEGRTVFCRINDAFLLGQLMRRLSEAASPASSEKGKGIPFIRLVMLRRGLRDTEYASAAVDEHDMDGLVREMFCDAFAGRSGRSECCGTFEKVFAASHARRFDSDMAALEAFGSELCQVGRDHSCIHEEHARIYFVEKELKMAPTG